MSCLMTRVGTHGGRYMLRDSGQAGDGCYAHTASRRSVAAPSAHAERRSLLMRIGEREHARPEGEDRERQDVERAPTG